MNENDAFLLFIHAGAFCLFAIYWVVAAFLAASELNG